MIQTGLLPWLDPQTIISATGPWAMVIVFGIVFAETGLLIGFLFPGDTLLLIAGLLTNTSHIFGIDIWAVCLAITAAAFLGGEAGYTIGKRFGPRIFERKESGIFSTKNVERTNAFFERYGPLAVILARFVPIVRTFTPIAAGIGKMSRRRYTIYNAAGAIIWGTGLTLFGFLIGYIPPIADFVKEYIDVILVGAVAVTALPILWHYIQTSRDARRARAAATENGE